MREDRDGQRGRFGDAADWIEAAAERERKLRELLRTFSPEPKCGFASCDGGTYALTTAALAILDGKDAP